MRTRAEAFVPEDSVLAEVRVRAGERGVATLGTGAASALSFLAAAVQARCVVEIGTGLGVGTVSLLRGMPVDGLLTTIDVEVENQRAARTATVAAGFSPGRVRMITGRALEVLPRLSDAAYDLVVVDAADVAALEYPRYLEEAVRLLRPGGVVAMAGVLAGVVADERHTGTAPAAALTATARDAVLGALRETAGAVRDDDRLVPVMLPLSEGLLCAAVR
jgi:predicted O-methyltransferase YrrM